jgi:hypothetical protein
VSALLVAQLVDAIIRWPEQGRPSTPGQIAAGWVAKFFKLIKNEHVIAAKTNSSRENR